MIIFRNPGLIDIAAVRTMGVSVKKPGSIGYFGTGLKFAIATILRGGGDIAIFTGDDRHDLGKRSRKIQGEAFDVVTLDNKELGFTTQLGRNWEPWMVLRELGSNATDEGGDFGKEDDVADISAFGLADHTTIVVRWDELDNAYRSRDELFLALDDNDARLDVAESITAWDRSSPYLFYRGIRAFKLQKPTRLTYNIHSAQTLTEDRHLLGTWNADAAIVQAVLISTDKEIVKEVICAGDSYHEHKLDFDKPQFKPTREFLDAAIAAKEAGARTMNESVKKLLLRIMRQERTESRGGSYSQPVRHYDALETAMEYLSRLGLDIDVDKNPIITVPELPEGVNSMVEEQRIYILDSMVEGASVDIDVWNLIHEIGRRYCELNCQYGGAMEAIDFLLPLLMDTDDKLVKVKAQYKADQELVPADDVEAADDDYVPPFDAPYEAPPVGPDLVDAEDDAPVF